MLKRRLREADEVKGKELPSAAGYRAWKNLLFQNVNTASGRVDDKALEWVRQVEDEALPDEHFRTVPIRFCTLSRKIAALLQRLGTGELGRKITQTAEDWIKTGRSVPGLVLLRLILLLYRQERRSGLQYR